jgi:uncharacterized protein (UPF0548 family)
VNAARTNACATTKTGLFTLTQPTEKTLRALIEENKDAPFSYPAVGASRAGPLPAGYNVDRNRVRLGSGHQVFEEAKLALQSWAMLDLGWVSVFPRDTKIRPGAVVAVVVSHFGFWSVNVSRIVFVENPCSFAYGTLDEHAESGEEKFTVSWDEADASVWYDVLAFSKPNHILARIGYPLSRILQKQFARDSMAAMIRLTE